MAYKISDEFRRPAPLALATVAIVGWLLVAYFSSRVSAVQSEMNEAVNRAEHAREGVAADLQDLQKASETARRCRTKLAGVILHDGSRRPFPQRPMAERSGAWRAFIWPGPSRVRRARILVSRRGPSAPIGKRHEALNHLGRRLDI
jgi:hypothetical protein